MKYLREELEQAKKALTASINKLEKVKETLSKKEPVPKSQLTLAERNLAAWKLSLSLVEKELTDTLKLK